MLVNGFEASFVILAMMLRGDNVVSKDWFVFCRWVKFLKEKVNVSSVSCRHRLAASSALWDDGTSCPFEKQGPRMFLMRRRDRKTMRQSELLLYGRSCNNLAELALPNQWLLDTLLSLMAFTTTFKMEHKISLLMLERRTSYKIYLHATLSVEPVSPVVCGKYTLQSLLCAILSSLSTVSIL